MLKRIGLMLTMMVFMTFLGATVALAEEAQAGTIANFEAKASMFAIIAAGAAIGMGLAAAGTGVGMGHGVNGALNGVARNPELFGRLLTLLMIGLAIIESLAIYTLVICLIILYANPFFKLLGL